VRYITFDQIARAIESLAQRVAHELPDDVIAALETAADNESSPPAKDILNQLLENSRLARQELIPLCQDTGLVVVFIEQGREICFENNADNPDWILDDAVNAGVAAGYEKGYLRKSIVAEPLDKRRNTQTNTPAVIHHSFVIGDKLKITLMAKGGGCENKSRFKMFKPTADKEQVIKWIVDVVEQAGADACPPFVVGIGLGGDFELSCLLSKKALLRKLNQPNSEKFYADMEKELLTKINSLGLGPQGLGGDTTALAAAIETAPCHIASLPVAVNIECHSHRHHSVTI